MRLGREPVAHEAPYDPDAWLKSLVPLKLFRQGLWDPTEEYWGEEGEPIGDWAKPIIKHGPRPMFEMEQVLPGWDPEDIDSDPIGQVVDLRDSGKLVRAKKLLEKLLIKDMRCLDAHAHLGNFAFDKDPESASLHYRRGVQIGQLALSADFEGVLSWHHIDNRPFLRCASGLALCLWRLRQFEEAETLCERLLWFSPSDNLGIRFILPRIRARRAWTPDEDRLATARRANYAHRSRFVESNDSINTQRRVGFRRNVRIGATPSSLSSQSTLASIDRKVKALTMVASTQPRLFSSHSAAACQRRAVAPT